MSLSVEIKFLSIDGRPYFESSVGTLAEAQRLQEALEAYFMGPGNVEITVFGENGTILRQTGFLKP